MSAPPNNPPNAEDERALPFGSPALAGKVKRQPLISFMSASRLKSHPNRDLLQIPAVDALLNRILNPSLPASQKGLLPARLRLPVIELSARGPCGKTHLLYLICAIAILPPQLGGKGRAAVVLDCKAQFCVNRLYEVMRGHARQHLAAPPTTSRQLHSLLKTALSHAHIFRPASSAELLLAVQSLRPYLYAGGHGSAKRRVDSILIDGMSAFLWADRYNDYHAVMVSQGHPDWIDLQARYAGLVRALREAAGALGAYVVATNIGFKGWRVRDLDEPPALHGGEGSAAAGGKPISERPYLMSALPAPWKAFVNVKIVLRHFQPAEESAGESRMFVGFSDTVGLGWGLQRAVAAANGGTGMFWFKIESGGVTVGASASL